MNSSFRFYSFFHSTSIFESDTSSKIHPASTTNRVNQLKSL
uniref:Uncharacterized protein n=1 Tax=Rhizophora mucronata TaxID=61149 RepID=A0A2P2J0Y2_RHIMU